MKLSKRLKTIADLVENTDLVADIGCDHAYLSIHLAENNLCKKIIATEVVAGPYNIALSNIKNAGLKNDIKLYLTDGLTNVNDELNTIIIAGMGAHTIIKILKEYPNLKKITKLIIQSNNDWELIRRYLNSVGFYIKNEFYVYEKNKDYITILAYQTNEKNTDTELAIGIYNPETKEFYQKQIDKLNLILDKIRDRKDYNYKKIKEKITLLESYLN